MATAENGLAIASTPAEGTLIFDADDDGGGCRTHLVRCLSSSANDVLVRVKNLHKSGEFLRIPVGDEMVFRAGMNDIRAIYAKGDGGAATIDHGTIAK